MEKFLVILFLCMLLMPSRCTSCSLECKCTTETADCRARALRILPPDLNTDVRALDLSHNLFFSIPDMSTFSNIEILILSHNHISLISAEALESLPKLTHLDLSFNLFERSSDIHESFLLAAPSIKHLDFSFNSLKSFPKLISNSLQTFILSNCSLSSYTPFSLEHLKNLENLQLAYNKFQVLPKLRSRRLKILNISSSEIQRVDVNAFDSLRSLSHLYLNRNYQLKEFAASSSSLSHLDLSECNLESIPRSILPNLTSINLGGNHIRTLRIHSFADMQNVQFINLTDNSIETIDSEAFSDTLALQKLDLSRNTITNLDPYTFEFNSNLEFLKLSRNYFQNFIPLKSSSILTLDLSHCEITNLKGNSLKEMTILKDLNLSGNQLITLPMDLASKSLERLHLANCRLTAIKNETFRRIPNIRYLNIEGNRLVELQFTDFETMGIRLIRLGDNPWRCDCGNHHFKELHIALDKIDSDVTNARCHSPENLEGKTWFEACGMTWYGYYQKGDKAWMISLCIMVVLFVGCCGFISVHRECRKRQRALEEEETRQRNRESLMVMIESVHVHENLNAPDPRELERPPSYHEAVAMPRLGSNLTLNNSKMGSSQTLNNNNLEGGKYKAKKRRRRRSGQRGSQASINDSQDELEQMTRSNPDLIERDKVKGTPKRTRRRRRSRSASRSQNLGTSDSERESYCETDV